MSGMSAGISGCARSLEAGGHAAPIEKCGRLPRSTRPRRGTARRRAMSMPVPARWIRCLGAARLSLRGTPCPWRARTRPGRNRIRTHTVLCPFGGELFGHRHDAAFRSRVCRRLERSDAAKPRIRCGVDHGAAAALAQEVPRREGRVEDDVELDSHHVAPHLELISPNGASRIRRRCCRAHRRPRARRPWTQPGRAPHPDR